LPKKDNPLLTPGRKGLNPATGPPSIPALAAPKPPVIPTDLKEKGSALAFCWTISPDAASPNPRTASRGKVVLNICGNTCFFGTVPS